MATFVLEDLTGSIAVTVWPKTYEKCRDLLADGEIPVLVRGRCESDGRGETRVLASAIAPLDSLWKENIEKILISVLVPKIQGSLLAKLQDLINSHPGDCPLEFELLKKDSYRIRVVPNSLTGIKPVSSFVQGVEDLFGENSVTLYT